MSGLRQEFIRFCIASKVLTFGEFKTKAGRLSPYFFNAGSFDHGAALGRLAEFYAKTIDACGVDYDMLFGPAYKGIGLAATTAVELARLGRDVPFAYNRKEAKDHGEGGVIVGRALTGRVLIIDDVISAGTSVRESVQLIRAAGAQVAGVVTRRAYGVVIRRALPELSPVMSLNGAPMMEKPRILARLREKLGHVGIKDLRFKHG
jgi:orotate phosphoribosyltransferase